MMGRASSECEEQGLLKNYESNVVMWLAPAI